VGYIAGAGHGASTYGGDTNPNSGPIGFLYGENDGGGGDDPSMETVHRAAIRTVDFPHANHSFCRSRIEQTPGSLSLHFFITGPNNLGPRNRRSMILY